MNKEKLTQLKKIALCIRKAEYKGNKHESHRNADNKTFRYRTNFADAKKIKGIVVAEDHFKYGGLYSAISEVVVDKYPCNIKPVSVDDTFGESGKSDELYEKYGLTEENIISKALDILEV